MNGILFINKPEGLTSRDVVNKVSLIFQTKKVGHTGTLDPMATGVLVLCLGTYTKLVDKITAYEKEYMATMKLGIKTDTLDTTGHILERKEVKISPEVIQQVFNTFPKEYTQTVPIYSAVKVRGKKLYEYAREKEEVALPTRKVEIKKLELLKIEKDEITFKALVSKGTYIRSLILDLAHQMNTVASMSKLVRTKQGDISLANCFSLEDIHINTPLKTIEDLFTYPKVSLNEEEYRRFLNGNKLALDTKDTVVFVTYQNKTVGIYEKEEELYRLMFKAI